MFGNLWLDLLTGVGNTAASAAAAHIRSNYGYDDRYSLPQSDWLNVSPLQMMQGIGWSPGRRDGYAVPNWAPAGQMRMSGVPTASQLLDRWIASLPRGGGAGSPASASPGDAGGPNPPPQAVASPPNPPTPSRTSNPNIDQWNDHINAASAATGVPAPVIKAIMDIESGGRANALGTPTQWGRAQGLMQVMPFHFNKDGSEDPLDPSTNIHRGAEILARNFHTTGDWDQAAARYFGLGTDVNGTTTEVYLKKYRDALARHSGS